MFRKRGLSFQLLPAILPIKLNQPQINEAKGARLAETS